MKQEETQISAGAAPPSTPEPFGRRLARLLEEAEMTQAGLADAASIDPSQVSRMVSDRRLPSRADLDGICEALKTGLAELVVGTTAEPVVERTMNLVSAEELREAKAQIAAMRRKVSEAEAQSAQSRENETRAVKELAEARAELARRETELDAVVRERDAERARRLDEKAHFDDLLTKARRLQEVYRYTRGLLQRAVAENEQLAAQLAESQRQTRTAHRNGAAVGVAATTGLVGLFALLTREGSSEEDEDFDDED